MTLNCNGQLIDVSTPKVMGILNITPDSFYDGGFYNSEKNILKQTEKMLNEGATFIDLGAYSSRPKAKHISEDEELKRIIPTVELILKEFPNTLLSVDTFRSTVAKCSINAGACMINDISAGGLDTNMMHTIASLQVPYIMMHLKGTPQNMQQHTNYNDLVKDILFYFSERIANARLLGIVDLIIDPGFGFSKTLEQNYELLQKLELLNITEVPLMVGISRKSMIYKALKITSKDSLNGTAILHTLALQKGAKILRVHDVKEAMECITLMSFLPN